MIECCLCQRKERSNADVVICGPCVQSLMQADLDDKVGIQEKLKSQNRSVAIEMLDHFLVRTVPQIAKLKRMTLRLGRSGSKDVKKVP